MQPVTTNPVIIMCINMTVVFAVLYGLSLMIRLIHVLDPTKKKEVPTPAAPKAVSAEPVVPAASALDAEGISPEIVAVIAAAVAAYGGSAEIRSIRPIPRPGWKSAARMESLQR
jgi:glutaconyl-CoA decarboxylase